jgi:DNA (cytosine-5)-methyltransferase 1
MAGSKTVPRRGRTHVPSGRSRSVRRMLISGSGALEAGSRGAPLVVELFAGAGGLALGLHRGGLRPTFVIDSDPLAYQTLKANKKKHTRGWRLENSDVRKLDYAAPELVGAEVVSAGAPCQPFSAGGRLRGEDDSRNMFPEVVRAVRELRPRAFIFENVRGLLFERVRPYFDYILAQLKIPSRIRGTDETWRAHLRALQAVPGELHEYRVEWRLLNAADFGLAQNRPRLVVVGVRSDETKTFDWPQPTHSRSKLVAALRDDDYWDEHGVPAAVKEAVQETLPARVSVPADETGRARWVTVRDLMRTLGPPADRPPANGEGGDPAHVFVPGARLYKKHTGSALDWPAKTVKAGVHGCPGGEHIVRLDDGGQRYFSVRECASLQGFPVGYVLPELRTQAMRQIGNAVPVPLAEAIGSGLVEVLRNGET